MQHLCRADKLFERYTRRFEPDLFGLVGQRFAARHRMAQAENICIPVPDQPGEHIVIGHHPDKDRQSMLLDQLQRFF
jgi:hypothetical protein